MINENSQPLVTVIIPSYNHSTYVECAIVSVIRQTYKHVQLIVIDDGSTDSSVEKLMILKDKFNFTLIIQKNAGICKTLNRAIRESARGDYISILASDDYWHTEKLKIQINALNSQNISEFCFSQAIQFTDNNTPDVRRVFPKKCLSGKVLNDVFVRQHVPAGTMLFSRRLYDRLNGFDETLKEEDWDFIIRAAAITPFTSVNMPLLYYRSHQTNTMKTRERAEIFHQKAKILSKNFNLINPHRWLFVIVLHFIHDLIINK